MTTVVVLGAGASRAAGEYADRPKRNPQTGQDDRLPLTCLPPLNADFFTHLQRIASQTHQQTVQRVVGDVIDLFGSNFSLTLEDYFTQLEFLINVVDMASTTPDLDRTELLDARNNLMSALSAVLESSTNEITRRLGGCELHAALVRKLSRADCLISFNYDCLIDYALKLTAGSKWDARTGYRLPADLRIEGADYWTGRAVSRRMKRRPSIRLLKLHGSINWQLPSSSGGSVRLKQRLHQQNGTPRFSIIPPVWNKAFGSEATSAVYRHIWEEAARAIAKADSIVVVGFSFSATDLYAQSLFRTAVRKNRRLRLLVIATPSQETRRRIRGVFDVPLAENDPSPLVRQYTGLEDLVAHLPGAFV